MSDNDASLFTATVPRHELLDMTKPSGKTLKAVRQSASIAIWEQAELIGISERSAERNIQNLQDEGRLRRIGLTKGGHWIIAE